ncbi:MAG TPA: acylphosphatase, partial [Tissierellaceae bacterium]|nr:acylphosphatase [Tissierellaceae bacterium]
MGLKKIIDKLKKKYISNKVAWADVPEFSPSNLVRKRIIFSGRVQNVGFRYEVFNMANRLELTGWVKNLADGNVESEIQGTEEKILFLTEHMKSLKRAQVEDVTIEDLEV